jgi:hypothetical protein
MVENEILPLFKKLKRKFLVSNNGTYYDKENRKYVLQIESNFLSLYGWRLDCTLRVDKLISGNNLLINYYPRYDRNNSTPIRFDVNINENNTIGFIEILDIFYYLFDKHKQNSISCFEKL